MDGDDFIKKKGFAIYSSVHVIHLDRVTYYVKFRPYLLPFLRAIHEHFELHLYTHSRRDMAEAVLMLFGDEQRLFSKIVTREEVRSTKRKSLSSLRLDEDQLSTVIIVDDNYRNVWGIRSGSSSSSKKEEDDDATMQQQRIIQIPPFVYFNRALPNPNKERKLSTSDRQYYLGEGECSAVRDEELMRVYEQLVVAQL